MDQFNIYDKVVTSTGETIFTHKYLNHKEKALDTEDMPSLPVDPNELIPKVIDHLKKFNNVISRDSPKQIEAFCKLFNYNIQLNKENSKLRLVHAAQTGTAKSLSLKVYASMLQTQSSLIVVSKVDEAKEYCEFINKLREDSNYAKCYYAITDKNKNSPYRVENYQLPLYQCIVISHAMFQQLNQLKNLDFYKLYNGKQRDFIAIDEKVNLYTKSIVSFKELTNLKETITNLASSLGKDNFTTSKLDSLIKEVTMYGRILKANREDEIFSEPYLDLLVTGYPFTNEDYEDEDYEEDEEYSEELILTYTKNCKDELQAIMDLIKEKVAHIMQDIALLSSVSSGIFNDSITKDKENLLNRIEQILITPSSHIFIYVNSFDVHTFSVDNIVNKLGSCVVLDATANVNEHYKIAYYSNPDVKNTTVLRSRKYSNLTIYKAKGYSQGRSSIFKSKSKNDRIYNARMYICHAGNVLSSSADKMLIISHKEFKKYLQEECSDTRIQFTHWGDHIGKNDWSDCNKVMVIGWNYISDFETLCNGINALNDISKAQWEISPDIVSALSRTQIVDDLVQGVMRTQARRIDTIDGECKPTEVYLYYQDVKEYNDTLDILIEQFPKVKIINWEPIGLKSIVKKTKPNSNVDRIIAYLEEKKSSGALDVMWKDTLIDLEINKSTGSRIIQENEYFKEQLSNKGYKLKNSDGKRKYIILE